MSAGRRGSGGQTIRWIVCRQANAPAGAGAYGYDAVGNVRTLGNNAVVPASMPATKGCKTAYTFQYDDLYQLTGSGATCTYSNGLATDKYTLSLSYDSIHNIAAKNQSAVRVLPNGTQLPNGGFIYNWTYSYGGSRPHAATTIGTRNFLYGLNG